MSNKIWNVYLSGEIHTDWRDQIIRGAKEQDLPIVFSSAVTNHEDSDRCGVEILGNESDKFWEDHKGAKVNALRTRTLIQSADIVVVRFGDKFRQWNAAFDAGIASALGKSVITLHDEALIHPLKEINGTALASARTPAQVVRLLDYTITGSL